MTPGVDATPNPSDMALDKTIYIGPFVHCATLTELDICINGMIGVDTDGKIAFILRDVKGRQIPADQGWEQAKIVRVQNYGFFFPGFIGRTYPTTTQVINFMLTL